MNQGEPDRTGESSEPSAKPRFKIPLPKSLRKSESVDDQSGRIFQLGNEREAQANPIAESAAPIPGELQSSRESPARNTLDDESFKAKFDEYFAHGFVPYAILGDAQSGKTVMLMRLFEYLLIDYREDERTIIAHDEETEKLFFDYIVMLENGKWPPGTEAGSKFIYAYHYKPQNFMFIDLSGADFEDLSFVSGKAPLRFEYLHKCRGFLYLLDSTGLNSSAAVWQYHKRFQAFVTYLRSQNSEAVKHPIVIALSKADILPDQLDTLYYGQGPYTLARKLLKPLYNLVREVFKYYKFVYLSSVGIKPDPLNPGLMIPVAGSSRPPLGFDDVLEFLTQTATSSLSVRLVEKLARITGRDY